MELFFELEGSLFSGPHQDPAISCINVPHLLLGLPNAHGLM